MKHKTKLFKEIFESNADDIAGLIDSKEPVMTKETFVPLLGQMWAKTKAQYKKRYRQKVLHFAEWVNINYQFSNNTWKGKKGDSSFTIEELFEIWKKKNKFK